MQVVVTEILYPLEYTKEIGGNNVALLTVQNSSESTQLFPIKTPFLPWYNPLERSGLSLIPRI